jgi:hypothetical protein
MNEDTMKQYALPMIAIGVILMIAGGYQAFNPVLAVSAHDDRADVQRMLAITTFTVEGFNPTVSISGVPTGSVQEGTPVSITCTWDYDGMPNRGDVALIRFSYDLAPFIHIVERVDVTADTGSRTFDTVVDNVDADVSGVVYVCALRDSSYVDIADEWSSEFTITDTPIPPAQIDDATDTLTLDADTYSPGDTIQMQAWGENIGGCEWFGEVTFTVTQPNGAVYVTQESGPTFVSAGGSATVDGSFTLPSDATAGTWTIQSKWIDEDGNVHALSTIDLGIETIWGYDISMIGALTALIGLLLVGYGFAKRKS